MDVQLFSRYIVPFSYRSQLYSFISLAAIFVRFDIDVFVPVVTVTIRGFTISFQLHAKTF